MSAHICSFSDGKTYRLNFEGKIYYFDFSVRFGPWFETKTGREANQDVPNAVLDAISQWSMQGKRVCENGLCVWRPKNTTLMATKFNGLLWAAELNVLQDDRCGCPIT